MDEGAGNGNERLARRADNRIWLGFGGGCCLNLVILGVLGLGLLGGVIFVYRADRSNLPWLFGADGLSVLAFLGAASATILRYIHDLADFLPDGDTYAKATMKEHNTLKFDLGIERRTRHQRLLNLTGSISILILSGMIELISLVLKGIEGGP